MTIVNVMCVIISAGGANEVHPRAVPYEQAEPPERQTHAEPLQHGCM